MQINIYINCNLLVIEFLLTKKYNLSTVNYLVRATVEQIRPVLYLKVDSFRYNNA